MGKSRKRVLSVLKYLLMVFLIAYLFKSGKLNLTVFSGLYSAGFVSALFLSIILILLNILIFTKRYQIVITAAGGSASYKDVFKIVNIGIFFSNFLPSSAGGDIFRIYYLRNSLKIPVMQGTAITLLDRVLAFLGLIVLSAVSLAAVLIIKGGGSLELGGSTALWISIIVILTLCIGGIFLLRIPFFYNLAEKITGKTAFGRKLLPFLSTAKTLVHNSKACLLSLTFAVCGHILFIAVVTFIAYSMYGQEAALASTAVSGLVFAATVIPLTPGNLGWTEFAAEVLFNYMGSGGGAAIFLVWRAVFLIFSLLGGVFYLTMGKTSE
jgi:uncharacterized protein (TIRG00374 family)